MDESTSHQCDRGSQGLEVVEALCRLQLEARRLGCSIRVIDASDELVDLINFAGLGGVLLDEARREVEECEEAVIDEIVDAGDEPI